MTITITKDFIGGALITIGGALFGCGIAQLFCKKDDFKPTIKPMDFFLPSNNNDTIKLVAGTFVGGAIGFGFNSYFWPDKFIASHQ